MGDQALSLHPEPPEEATGTDGTEDAGASVTRKDSKGSRCLITPVQEYACYKGLIRVCYKYICRVTLGI